MAVPNVKYDNRIRFDGEEHSVLMWLAAIKKLANLERKVAVFRREHATFGHVGERCYGILQFSKPPQARIARLFLQQPFQDDV